MGRTSEKKKKLIEELTQLHKALSVPKLYDFPDHKITKDWLAEVASILKQLGEGDYKRFGSLRELIYPSVPRGQRFDAAQRIDNFVRQKVAEYKRYDFEISPEKDKIDIFRLTNPLYWIYKVLNLLLPSIIKFFRSLYESTIAGVTRGLRP